MVRLAVETGMLTYSFADLGSDSLYGHLYKCIRNDILKGVLAPGTRLPSKRAFAKNLGISTITVENAYQQLMAEGYLYSVPKKGYFVADITNEVKAAAAGTPEEVVISPEQADYFADFVSNSTNQANFPFSIWARLMRETISGTATVMLIIVSATVFGYYLNWENIPTMLLNAVTSFASNKFLVLLVMNVVLLIVGMFLEGGAALIILAPLMVPIVKAAGIDLVHFGIVCNVNIMIGGLTPPFGSMMFTCVSITGCKMQEFIKECVPFIIALLIALLLLTYIPGISMLIPNLIY